MHRLLLAIAALVLVLTNCQVLEQPRQAEISRYFNDGDRLGDYPLFPSQGLVTKRKQFYAWAGKRTGVPEFVKRKQFYAWAGK
ncbi:unnamed protein product [Cylicocyclus nassatus]|uniref:Uncharacterized protein n=1 Tax=Cylicocyclus nassatus TaxID=53992 RepID=A0AA36GXH1_CYLNA|nr:unnamed protein product [Cylicocyclus nassatus]